MPIIGAICHQMPDTKVMETSVYNLCLSPICIKQSSRNEIRNRFIIKGNTNFTIRTDRQCSRIVRKATTNLSCPRNQTLTCHFDNTGICSSIRSHCLTNITRIIERIGPVSNLRIAFYRVINLQNAGISHEVYNIILLINFKT